MRALSWMLMAACVVTIAACSNRSSDSDSQADGDAVDMAVVEDAAMLDTSNEEIIDDDASAGDEALDAAPPDEDASIDVVEEEAGLPDWLASARCGMTPPEGAALAAPPPAYSGGTCPELVAGMNQMTSGAREREFMLVLPADPQPGERFPVLFMWHWLQASANSFYSHGEVRDAVDQQRFIAVIPESPYDIDLFGLIQLPWPFVNFVSQARVDEELVFFDDMLSCVSAQFDVDKECVSTAGVSAGALWTVVLASARSQYLASMISLSGGVGVKGITSNFVRQWSPPPRRLPAVVLWGGPQDSCIMLNFQSCSQELERNLVGGGHFFVECIHNCKHGEPPIDPPEGLSRYYTLWDFMFKHPFWVPAGLSPFTVTGLPVDYIPWCGIGMGSAVPRTGECPPPDCPI